MKLLVEQRRWRENSRPSVDEDERAFNRMALRHAG
jgi:hypothetical protein